MKSSNIGGQAVMEGIMMRHKDKYSIAVRRPDQEIELKVEDYKCTFGNHAFLKKPIIRGVVSFVDSLVVGTKCLMYSAEIAGDEEDEETAKKNEQLTEEELSAKKAKEDKQFKWLLYITVAVSIGHGDDAEFRGGVVMHFFRSLCCKGQCISWVLLLLTIQVYNIFPVLCSRQII